MFVFSLMTRGSAERIVVLPFGDHSQHTPATRPRRTRALTGAGSRDGGVGGADAIPSARTLAGFSLSAASCAIKNDEHRLLGVIEAAFGDHASFESLFRALLCSRVFGPSAQCRGSRADGSGSSRSERPHCGSSFAAIQHASGTLSSSVMEVTNFPKYQCDVMKA